MKSRLLDIESYIESRPDSALSVIKTIDTLSLNSNALRAKYSLLHAMALDKNYIDTTDLSVILPAVDYYSKNGSPDERLKAYFYKGRIQMNAGKLSDAAISFSRRHKLQFSVVSTSGGGYVTILKSIAITFKSRNFL